MVVTKIPREFADFNARLIGTNIKTSEAAPGVKPQVFPSKIAQGSRANAKAGGTQLERPNDSERIAGNSGSLLA